MLKSQLNLKNDFRGQPPPFLMEHKKMNDATATIPTDGLSLDELQRDPFSQSQNVQYGSPEDDKHLIVRFYMHPVEQTAQSIRANRKIFKDTEYVEILTPGDKYNIVRRQVFDMDRRRFSDLYAKFKAGQSQENIGTPLSEAPFISAAKAKEYAFFNVYTIEQLAKTADGAQTASVMGFPDDKQKAQAYLTAAEGQALNNEVNAQLEARDRVIEKLQAQVEELAAKPTPTKLKG